MTAVLMTLPVMKFTDSAGAPLAGGKVYFYTAGTSTPKDTYTTAAGSVANTNPVILDSSGAAVIFMSGSYKINLTDSSGSQQANFPVDNVTTFSSGAVSATVSDGTFTVQNASDITKQGTVSLAGLTTGTTVVLTWPTANGTIARTADVTDAALLTTDVTTNNVSTTKHGFAPKAPNDATKYLDGTGAYSTPALAGSLTTIASGNLATGSPTLVDITSIPATYRELTLYVSGATNTVATRALRVDVDTGSGLGNAANCASYIQIAGSTPTNVSTAANRLMTDVTQTAAQVTSVRVDFPAYQSGPVKKFFLSAMSGATAGAEWAVAGTQTTSTGVLCDASSVSRTGAITGIRLTWDNVGTGVFDGGTYALYGVN